MSNSDKETHRLREQLHRNQVLTAVIAAALVGFVVAAYLGAFSTTSLKEVPAWISALTAVVAAVISAYAVYLVAHTLDATRQTLRETKRIGDAQLRPWVLVEGFAVSTGVWGPDIRVLFHNYGVSHASPISFYVCIDCYRYHEGEFVEYNEDGTEKNYLGEWQGALVMDDYLVPHGKRLVEGCFFLAEMPEGTDYMYLKIKTNYSDFAGSVDSGKDDAIILRGVTLSGTSLDFEDGNDSLLVSWRASNSWVVF